MLFLFTAKYLFRDLLSCHKQFVYCGYSKRIKCSLYFSVTVKLQSSERRKRFLLWALFVLSSGGGVLNHFIVYLLLIWRSFRTKSLKHVSTEKHVRLKKCDKIQSNWISNLRNRKRWTLFKPVKAVYFNGL